jgi:hypothetical protein
MLAMDAALITQFPEFLMGHLTVAHQLRVHDIVISAYPTIDRYGNSIPSQKMVLTNRKSKSSVQERFPCV